jgi:hypothetical protein
VGVVAYVVAIGKRANWTVETRSGWAGPAAVVARGPAAGRGAGLRNPMAPGDAVALDGAAVPGEVAIPQPVASAAMASAAMAWAVTGMAALAFPAAGQSQSNGEISRIEVPSGVRKCVVRFRARHSTCTVIMPGV